MSQLLLKLDAKDNIPFSREMHRIEKEENALDLLDWLTLKQACDRVSERMPITMTTQMNTKFGEKLTIIP